MIPLESDQLSETYRVDSLGIDVTPGEEVIVPRHPYVWIEDGEYIWRGYDCNARGVASRLEKVVNCVGCYRQWR